MGFSTGDGLRKAEEEREIAMNPLVLQQFCSANSFPGARNLYQNAFSWYTLRFVQRDQLSRFADCTFRIEAQTCCHLRGDAAWHHLEDFAAKQDKQLVDELLRHRLLISAPLQCQF